VKELLKYLTVAKVILNIKVAPFVPIVWCLCAVMARPVTLAVGK